MKLFYIAYSYIENNNSANQIQSRLTFLSLNKLIPNLKGIFLGTRGNIKNPFWPIRQEKDKFFIDKSGWQIHYIEKLFSHSWFRRIFFPYLFAKKCGSILEKDNDEKFIYIRPAAASEAIYYLDNLDKFKIDKIVFELHNITYLIPNFYRFVWEKKCAESKFKEFLIKLKKNKHRVKLVTLTACLADIIHNKFNYGGNIKIISDAHGFINKIPKEVGFDKNKIEIIYTGLSFKLRGIEMLINALTFLPDKFFVELIGGKDRERDALKKKYKNFISRQRLILKPPIPHDDVKQKLMNADIAVLPTPEKGFSRFTSPLKLFEYMAMGMPIIASDTQSFREILTSENALFFKPNNSRDLAKKINYLLENEGLAKDLGKQAFKDSQKYTYFQRAKRIYNIFLNG